MGKNQRRNVAPLLKVSGRMSLPSGALRNQVGRTLQHRDSSGAAGIAKTICWGHTITSSTNDKHQGKTFFRNMRILCEQYEVDPPWLCHSYISLVRICIKDPSTGVCRIGITSASSAYASQFSCYSSAMLLAF